MSYDLYLSYSGRYCYLTCPKQYWYRYEEKDKTRIDVRSSLFGSIIGTVFEWFYEKRTWALSDVTASTMAMIEPAMEMNFVSEKFEPDSDKIFVATLREELNEFVPAGVEVIRTNGLLTDNSRAEVDLTVVYRSDEHDLTVKMGGRTDFLHGYGDNVWILDGKGGKHRDKYVDPEQVIWYALLHYLRFRVAPTRIGFVYWKFPKDPLQWVDYDGQSFRDSVSKTFEVAKKIQLKMFNPIPSEKCKPCNYRNKCEEGRKHVAAMKVEDDGRIETSIFDMEHV